MSIGIFFGIFLVIIGSFFIFMCGMILNDGDSEGIGLGLFSFMVVALGLLILFAEISEDYYKEGQVDVLSGNNIQYEVKVQPDSSRVWVKKDGD